MDSTIEVIPVKRGRGRPAKYTPEERKERHKQLKSAWNKEHYKNNTEQEKQMATEYQSRARSALRLLNELWLHHRDDVEFKSDRYPNLIREIVENKKVISL
jgi:hypothetical protein